MKTNIKPWSLVNIGEASGKRVGTLLSAERFDAGLARQGEILRQLDICQNLLRQRAVDAGIQTASIRLWRDRLLAALSGNIAPTLHPLNVDVESSDPQRVAEYWRLVADCVTDLDAENDADAQANVATFLLHVAWHEGARLTARQQFAGGPGRSFFQFEAYRAKEALDYAAQIGLTARLAAIANHSEAEIIDARQTLPDYGEPEAAYFSAGNLIEDLLLDNDLFAVYLARVAFRKIAAPIPADNTGQAAYWYEYWKVSGGDPDLLTQDFYTEAGEVDAMIPAAAAAPRRQKHWWLCS